MNYKKILKSIISGLLIGCAGLILIIIKSIDFPGNHFIASLIFPIGITLALILDCSIFTGSISHAVGKNKTIPFHHVLLILLFNIIGIVFIGIIFNLIKLFNIPFIDKVQAIANTKFMPYELFHISELLLKSLTCGILLSIGIYLFRYLKSPFLKIISIWFFVFLYTYFGFNNGLTDSIILLASSRITIISIIYVLTAIIGNSLGLILMKHFSYVLTHHK